MTDLHDQVWPESAHTRDADARFGCTVGCSCATKNHGCCDAALFAEVIMLVRRVYQRLLSVFDERTMPMKGANLGDSSESAIAAASLCEGRVGFVRTRIGLAETSGWGDEVASTYSSALSVGRRRRRW